MVLDIFLKQKGIRTQYICKCGLITLYDDMCSECRYKMDRERLNPETPKGDAIV